MERLERDWDRGGVDPEEPLPAALEGRPGALPRRAPPPAPSEEGGGPACHNAAASRPSPISIRSRAGTDEERDTRRPFPGFPGLFPIPEGIPERHEVEGLNRMKL